MVAVAVAGVSCKREGERAISGERALMDGHDNSYPQHASTWTHNDPRTMHLPSCKLADYTCIACNGSINACTLPSSGATGALHHVQEQRAIEKKAKAEARAE
eukprot:scaffold109641_cov27-Phaeocystis_antarctica.AAC.1